MQKIIPTVAIFFLFLSCNQEKEVVKPCKQLLMNIQREPPTLDPRKGSELVGSTMQFILFEGLMRLNPDGSLTPAQAASVALSDDRKTYTFVLKETVWSDGSPVVAKDFERAWKKILTPDFPAPNAHLLYPIKNAENAKYSSMIFIVKSPSVVCLTIPHKLYNKAKLLVKGEYSIINW